MASISNLAGNGGTLVASMGCAACFPALGTLGASIGLGFLSSFEGVIVNQVLPGFALLALILNSYQWGRHAHHLRGALSLLGPLAVLLTLYPLWSYGWSTYLFYAGLGMMFGMSIFEFIRPAQPVCLASDQTNA